ncbi:MAG TPA: wax ester/triacylglycerol synthase family O-acyltransferase [Actinomycetota bacterium]
MKRLSSFDLMFLRLETREWPCHFGGLAVVDGATLVDGEGRLRIEEIAARLEPRLARVPALRRRLLVPGPLGGRPLWVDDPRFSVARHLRQVAVPAPGDDRRLLETAARVYGPRLDRRRPLWELWFLTGLADDRVGVLLKLHHAVADGMAAVAIMGSLFDADPNVPDPPPAPWAPEPTPSGWSLVADNLATRWAALRRALAAVRRPERFGASLRRARRIAVSYAGRNPELQAARTSLNRPVRAGRRVGFLRLELADVKDVAHAHGGTVNDVVLDLWAGGLRHLLVSRGESVSGLELITGVPVSLRPEGDATVENRSGWIALPLPAWEADAARRLALIAERTRTTKATQQPAAIAGFMAALAATPIGRAYTTRQRTSHTVVTNVPGPPAPVYLLGARVRGLFPIIELVGNLGQTLCAFSYDGAISLVVTADATTFPDLDVLVEGMARCWDALTTTAGPGVSVVSGVNEGRAP